MTGDPPERPTAAEIKALRTLVEGIVLAQGNVFIKKLLRDQGIKIGATKPEFEKNLVAAIEEGRLRQSDVSAWLDEVEGWGDQHIYLYSVPVVIANDPLWRSVDDVAKRIKGSNLSPLWDAQASLEYPGDLKLTGVYFDGKAVRFVWHQGLGDWVRDKDEDREDTIEGDLYEFRAYRQQMERMVMRFEMRPSDRLAAAFIKIPWNKETHDAALQEIKAAIAPLVDLSKLRRLSISNVIKNLDDAELRAPARAGRKITAQRTRLNDAGIYIEFASTSSRQGYQASQSVRDVRHAVQSKKFKGTGGSFVYSPPGKNAVERVAKIALYGRDVRIRLRPQLTATQVWEILDMLKENA